MEQNLEKILPHSRPMIMIDSIDEINIEEGYIISSVTINEDKIFFDKILNGTDALLGIEFMAQTIAGCSFFKYNIDKPKIGFLLGTRSYKCSLEKFENGKTYSVKARELYCDMELVSYECFIYNEGMEVASAVINAYQPQNSDEFLKSGI